MSCPTELRKTSCTGRAPAKELGGMHRLECKKRSLTFVPARDREHADQMTCDACGGMFDMPTLELLAPTQKLDTNVL